MDARHTFVVLGTAAVAGWLIQPAVAQVSSEAVPGELRIIEDLPEAVEEGRDILERSGSRLEDAANDEPTEEARSRADGRDDSLFDDDQSLLFAPSDATPAERLLPDRDDVPEIGLDPRSRGEDRVDPPAGVESDSLTNGAGLPEGGAGSAETLAEPPDPSGPDAEVGGTIGSGTAESGVGGSGSLF